jgi:hypothetical protein
MGTHNHTTHNFNEQFEFSGKAKTWSIVAILIGVLSIAYGFLLDKSELHNERTFANLLLMGYYFTCVCAAGTFFIALQFVAQAGWSAGLLRIPQAFAKVLPIASIVLITIILAGLLSHNLYQQWNPGHHEGGGAEHALSASKASFLNVPFFIIRQVFFLGIYCIFALLLTKYSNNEDQLGGLTNHNKSIKMATIFLVLFGFTSPIWAFDTIMSIEAHWFSTMFGWYNFAAMWVSGICAITLTIILLKKAGYLNWINHNHLHDLGKFIFAFSIFWTYVWFAQFILIWYANIPEETVYFYKRWEPEYKFWFWLNIVINFLSPVLILMTRDAKRQTNTLMFVCILLLCGHWLDYYMMIMPGSLESHRDFGITEIGIAVGFVGLFTFLMLSKLATKPLVAQNHPLLEESLHHQI